MAVASELNTKATRGDSPGSPLTGRETAPRGVRSAVRTVLRPYSPWFANLHITGKEMRGVENAWYRLRNVAEAESRF